MKQVSSSQSQRSAEAKKNDRILAIRRSARKSRERKKMIQEELESSVVLLAKQNDCLRQDNANLNAQVKILTSLLNNANNQYNTEMTPIGVGHAQLPHISHLLSNEGHEATLLGNTRSAPLGGVINLRNNGELQAISYMQKQESILNSDNATALLDLKNRYFVQQHLPQV